MPDTLKTNAKREGLDLPPALMARSFLGGILMGLANLVPGISGGTMLLATGIYDRFIEAVSQVTTFRFRLASIIMLAIIIAGGGLAILIGAEWLGTLVHEQRWIMFSLFIGLTLGGVPLLWSMIQPIDTSAMIGCLVGLLAMALLAWIDLDTGGPADVDPNWIMLLVAGAAGGATMVLPGVSGSYLLLILGQYLVILTAITALKDGQTSDAMQVLIPVAIGAALGIVVVSNIMQWFLQNARKVTLGVLLGFLLGAVLGLWPFHAPVDEAVLMADHGLDPMEIEVLKPRNWPIESFAPSAGQVLGALGLILGGFLVSLGITMLGRQGPSEPDSTPLPDGK